MAELLIATALIAKKSWCSKDRRHGMPASPVGNRRTDSRSQVPQLDAGRDAPLQLTSSFGRTKPRNRYPCRQLGAPIVIHSWVGLHVVAHGSGHPASTPRVGELQKPRHNQHTIT
ncbi:MAG: hypothetical protein JWR48_3122 [Mycobacterium sp.]|nr:hypothetical protein [Mycobacterium sp.]